MSTYTPDSWAPVLIESDKYGKVYKILASWYGGYAGSDYWKLSSGVESITVSEDGKLTMPQASGSVYVVGGQPHVSMLMGAVFADFEKQAEENGFTIKMIDVADLLEAFK
jgi:hypothetical protein